MSDIEIKKQIRHLVSLTLKGGPGSGPQGGRAGKTKKGRSKKSKKQIDFHQSLDKVLKNIAYSRNDWSSKLRTSEREEFLNSSDDNSLKEAALNKLHTEHTVGYNTEKKIKDIVFGKEELTDKDRSEISDLLDEGTGKDGDVEYTRLSDASGRIDYGEMYEYTSRIESKDVADSLYREWDRKGYDGVGYNKSEVIDSFAYFGHSPEIRESFRLKMKLYGSEKEKDLSSEGKWGDSDKFQKSFVDDWTRTSGQSSSYEYKYATQEVFGKENTFLYANGYSLSDSIIPDPLVVSGIKDMYNKTQNYYTDKKISNAVLYRGVSQEIAVHAPVESWSLSEGSAKKFDGAGVIKKTIPIKDVLFTYKTVDNWPELDVIGKKEFGVIGNNIKMYED